MQWSRCSAERREQDSDRLRVTEGAEDGFDSRTTDGGEEAADIHPQNRGPCNMRRDKGADGAALEEAVRGRVRRNRIENTAEHLALQVLEPDLRGFDEPDVCSRFGEDEGLVMAKSRLRRAGTDALCIGEP